MAEDLTEFIVQSAGLMDQKQIATIRTMHTENHSQFRFIVRITGDNHVFEFAPDAVNYLHQEQFERMEDKEEEIRWIQTFNDNRRRQAVEQEHEFVVGIFSRRHAQGGTMYDFTGVMQAVDTILSRPKAIDSFPMIATLNISELINENGIPETQYVIRGLANPTEHHEPRASCVDCLNTLLLAPGYAQMPEHDEKEWIAFFDQIITIDRAAGLANGYTAFVFAQRLLESDLPPKRRIATLNMKVLPESHCGSVFVQGLEDNQNVEFDNVEDAVNHLLRKGYRRFENHKELQWMKRMDRLEIADYYVIRSSRIVGLFVESGDTHQSTSRPKASTGSVVMASAQGLAQSVAQSYSWHPVIATISKTNDEQSDRHPPPYLVRGFGDESRFRFMEEAVNYLANAGYMRLTAEKEGAWQDLVRRAHGLGGEMYEWEQGVLICVFSKQG